ncbi:MAG: hypothetical protein M1815_005162 [Lichina confinis]|nr:MAG: hypothetical protein M1815_005162 [Lichina confinis]
MASYDPLTAHPSLGLHIADSRALPILSSGTNARSATSESPDTSPSSSSSSSSPSSRATEALTKLTTTFLSARDIAPRFGHGALQRVVIETDGGVGVTQSYIESPTASSSSLSSASSAAAAAAAAAANKDRPASDGQGQSLPNTASPVTMVRRQGAAGVGRQNQPQQRRGQRQGTTDADLGPPSLVTTVVAPPDAAGAGARRAQQELHVVAKAFQRAWMGEATQAKDENTEGNGPEESEGVA